MIRRVAALIALALCSSAALAQTAPAAGALTVHRIYATREFSSAPMPSADWLRDGRSYAELRPSVAGSGADLLRIDAATGATSVIAPASLFADERGRPI